MSLLLSGPIWFAGRAGGRERWRLPLPHGVDPTGVVRATLRRRGIDRTGSAPTPDERVGLPQVVREPDGDLVLVYDLPVATEPPPAELLTRTTPPRHAPGLSIAPGEQALTVQRVSASVIVWAQDRLLATRYSTTTGAPGAWALPGGGVDPGEDPRAGARRECWEETGQHVRVADLVRLIHRHWIGRAPSGRLEDFHTLGLVYQADCDEPTSPVVHDVGGSTADAAWVPAADVPRLGWSASSRWVAPLAPPGPG